MPFGGVFSPSIGLSLLKAELAAQGIPARVLYFSIRFAELVGQDFYYKLQTEGKPPAESLAGEWIFSRALFGARAENDDQGCQRQSRSNEAAERGEDQQRQR